MGEAAYIYIYAEAVDTDEGENCGDFAPSLLHLPTSQSLVLAKHKILAKHFDSC